jgi:phosphoserine phosphatase
MKRLHVFDMDGTLLPGTTASLQIARVVGGEEWLHSLEAEFRLGRLDTVGFAAALHRGWQALTRADVATAFRTAPKLDGIRRTVEAIRAGGDIAVVISMSPDFFVDEWLSYGFHAVAGSRFPPVPFADPFDPDGILTFDDKPRIVAGMRAEFGAESVIAYGDSQSDVPLFGVADVSVAVNADRHVSDLATVAYRGNDLYAAYELALARFVAPASMIVSGYCRENRHKTAHDHEPLADALVHDRESAFPDTPSD